VKCYKCKRLGAKCVPGSSTQYVCFWCGECTVGQALARSNTRPGNAPVDPGVPAHGKGDRVREYSAGEVFSVQIDGVNLGFSEPEPLLYSANPFAGGKLLRYPVPTGDLGGGAGPGPELARPSAFQAESRKRIGALARDIAERPPCRAFRLER
jgi:hypothetical protein